MSRQNGDDGVSQRKYSAAGAPRLSFAEPTQFYSKSATQEVKIRPDTREGAVHTTPASVPERSLGGDDSSGEIGNSRKEDTISNWPGKRLLQDTTQPGLKSNTEIRSVWRSWCSVFVSIIQFVSFAWAFPLLKIGRKRAVQPEDLIPVRPGGSSEELVQRLEDDYRQNINGAVQWPLLRAFLSTHRWEICKTGFLLFCLEASGLGQAVLLGMLLTGVADNDSSDIELYGTVCALAIVTLVRVILLNVSALAMWRGTMEIRASAIGILYAKIIRLPFYMISNLSTGSILNLVSNDVEKFNLSWSIHALWISPFEMAVIAWIGWRHIGAAIFVGIGILIALIPVQLILGKRYCRLRRQTAKQTDTRMSLMKEVLTGIASVKMAATESELIQRIEKLRADEASSIRGTAAVQGFTFSMYFGLITMCTSASLIVFTLQGGQLTSTNVFVTLMLFASSRLMLGYMLPTAIQNVSELRVTFQRIKDVLSMVEIATLVHSFQPSEKTQGQTNAVLLEVIGARCAWDHQQEPLPREGISLKAEAGTLTILSGPVGTGKTTLLKTIAREAKLQNGVIQTYAPTLYVSQEPWIEDTTLRENIVFGLPFQQTWYNEVLSACELLDDIQELPNGDCTTVGENGALLSGGQRARVALARTTYASQYVNNGHPCIMLLDDPFAALDTRIGKNIFAGCIQHLLQHHCIILVTPHQQYWTGASHIISFKTTEKFSSQETAPSNLHEVTSIKTLQFEETTSRRKQTRAGVQSLLVVQENDPSAVAQDQDGIVHSCSAIDIESPRRSAEEDVTESGSLSWLMIKAYIRMGGTIPTLFLTSILLISTIFLQIGTDLYLVYWISVESTSTRQENDTHRRNYGCAAAVYLIVIYIAAVTFLWTGVRASTRAYSHALSGVLGTTMHFFGSHSVGQILNRFGKDVGYLDYLLPLTAYDFLQIGLLCVAIAIFASTVLPIILVPIVPACVIFVALRMYYIRGARDIKRLEGAARSPIYSHFSTTLDGVETIHSVPGASDRFLSQFHAYQDAHTRAWYSFVATSRWLGSRLDTIVMTLVTALSIAIVAGRDSIDKNQSSLALAYMIQLTGLLQWCVRQSAELENQLTSVERVLEYRSLEREEAWVSCEGPVRCKNHGKYDFAGWPLSGNITVSNLSMWYNRKLGPVLADVSFSIRHGEKIGVVGRSGSGKSSLIRALLRMAPTSGTLTIDDVPTCTVPLSALRRSLCVIPQTPMLFEGSIRTNLDPFETSNERSMYSALKDVGLDNSVRLMGGLECLVKDGGNNFSMGQRQLLCLARAIVNVAHIIIMDEATANIDSATDVKIQAVLKKNFADATVIVVAHRLETILDSDRILVLERGRLIEDGSPNSLVQDEESSLSLMLRARRLSEHLNE